MIFFVYKLTFSNGKIYIGMSRTDKRGRVDNRYRQHEHTARSGKQLPIYNAWRKYGSPVQSIISAYSTREECALAEIDMIERHDSTNPKIGYNLMHGGEGLHAPPGSPMYALMREKVWNNPAVRAKLSAANKGKPPSPQTIAAANEFHKSDAGREAKLKSWTDERKTKQSESTRVQMTNGGAEHLRIATKGRPDPRSPEGKEAQRKAALEHMTQDRAKAMNAKAFSNPDNVRKFEEGRAAWRESDANAEHCRRIAQLAAAASTRRVVHVATGIEYPSCQALQIALGYSHQSSVSRLIKQGKVTYA